jgi:hypothetical protein
MSYRQTQVELFDNEEEAAIFAYAADEGDWCVLDGIQYEDGTLVSDYEKWPPFAKIRKQAEQDSAARAAKYRDRAVAPTKTITNPFANPNNRNAVYAVIVPEDWPEWIGK